MPSLKSRIILLRGLANGQIAYSGPAYVDLDLTTRCNLYCLGCKYHATGEGDPSPVADGVKDIDFDLVKRLCGELTQAGTRYVILIGAGEPMLHPRLFDIITCFKRAGFFVQLYTNGTLIDENRARELVESGLDVLKVSLWANSLDEYRACHPGVPDRFFSRTLEGIRMVTATKAKRQAQTPLVITTQPLNQHNYQSIEARVDLAHDLGCDGVRFGAYRNWQGEYGSSALSDQQIEVASQSVARSRMRLDALGMEHNIDEILMRYRQGETFMYDQPCYAGWFVTRIQVDGALRPCCSCHVPMGNLYENSFEEVWNGPTYRAFRQRALEAGGTASLGSDCDCTWCTAVGDNLQIHRYWKWAAPVAGRWHRLRRGEVPS